MVDCLLELERWDAAIALLRDNTFLPWEGARGVHAQWVSAHVGRAGQRLERGDVSRALDDYRAALTYPRNLGVGRAAYPEQARVHWLLAEAALKAGDEDTRVAHLTAGADERHRHPCEADIHKARCLRALGREAEADDVLQRLSEWVTKRLDTQPDDAQAVAIRRALEEAPGE
jgi:tetratricopeptide (TPR) repeat protein